MILEDYLAKTPTSAAWASRAGQVMPGGITADTRFFKPYAPYIRHAVGVHKTDVDGNVLLDFFGGHGALVLGHGHPRVNQSITDALAHGIQYASNHPLEVRWAERICRHVPTAERVRFTGSGTEATLLALRVARAATGRSKIVRIATHYHGWHDMAASGYVGQFDGSPAPGVLKEIADHTVLVPPGDTAALQAAFDSRGSEIAAIIMEPLGTHFGVVPVDDAFLLAGERIAHAHGALSILDEVISGFRVGLAGMQGIAGLQPDLTTLGKVAAGGLPGGAVCGLDRVLSVLVHGSSAKVLHQGTFTGNPITAAAAIATIDEVAEAGVPERINALGEYARHALDLMLERRGADWKVHGRFSAFHLAPVGSKTTADGGVPAQAQAAKDLAAMLSNLRMGMILEGVDIGSRGSGFMSAQHTEAHVDTLVAALDRVLQRMTSEMQR
ncbi:MAG: aminotransferase class III-fold pyridoxal phosphate-dependent enzyme [Proteobacteria bacterium]|nr:aminotransferase class III-fold pyridoxal phosphate-dependent enzyme [Pseudomonadota bacterium]